MQFRAFGHRFASSNCGRALAGGAGRKFAGDANVGARDG
jgi:hypothetical protein